jgi:membrane-associated protease RseP (regulator of RpoE activity)
MKSIPLLSFLAVAASSALAAPNEPAAPSTPAPVAKPAAVITSSHVTVTIESNGKKETHEIDLGNAPTIAPGALSVSSVSVDGAGTKAGATAAAAPLTFAPNSLLFLNNALEIPPGPTPWLGVTMEPVSDELRAQLPIEKGAGLVLRSVIPDGPAAQAGLQKNDVLVKLDDQILVNGNQLCALVLMKKDGEKVRLTYFRGGKSSTTEAQIRLHQDPYTGTTTLNASGNLGETVVVDKEGHVLISRNQPDLSAVTAQVEKILRAAGVDDKTVLETEGAIVDAAKAANSAASSIGSPDGDVARQLKNAADQVAKSLAKARAGAENARAATEHARKQVEETRERLQKQSEPPKAPAGQ